VGRGLTIDVSGTADARSELVIVRVALEGAEEVPVALPFERVQLLRFVRQGGGGEGRCRTTEDPKPNPVRISDDILPARKCENARQVRLGPPLREERT